MPDESTEASLPCCFTCKKRFLLVVNGFFVILYVIYFITQVIVPLANGQAINMAVVAMILYYLTLFLLGLFGVKSENVRLVVVYFVMLLLGLIFAMVTTLFLVDNQYSGKTRDLYQEEVAGMILQTVFILFVGTFLWDLVQLRKLARRMHQEAMHTYIY